jgi:hypothetical protein
MLYGLEDEDEESRTERVLSLVRDHAKTKQYRPSPLKHSRLLETTLKVKAVKTTGLRHGNNETLTKMKASIGLTDAEIKSVRADYVSKGSSGMLLIEVVGDGK